MRVEFQRIRDVKRQDICEMVQNNPEAIRLIPKSIWTELVNNGT
jgi:hypothetical protein